MSTLITRSDDERIRDSYWMLVNPFKATPDDRWSLFRDSLYAMIIERDTALQRLTEMEKKYGQK